MSATSDEDDDHRDHDGGLEALVAVADRKIAETPCPDSARHRGGADQQHERHREARDQAWQRFRDERLADDGPVSPAHRSHRLDEAAVDLAERRLGDAAEVGMPEIDNGTMAAPPTWRTKLRAYAPNLIRRRDE
jgi:hypothetical protein